MGLKSFVQLYLGNKDAVQQGAPGRPRHGSIGVTRARGKGFHDQDAHLCNDDIVASSLAFLWFHLGSADRHFPLSKVFDSKTLGCRCHDCVLVPA